MKPDNKNKNLINEFTPFLERPAKVWFLKISVLFLFIALGFYAFYVQVKKGHIVTGMRDHVVWGIYIINFIFFLGLSYAGALISCIFHLARIQWGKPLMRMLEMMAAISLVIAPVYILLCIGRVDRLHHLLIYARIQSPITWDVIAIVTDLFFCFVFLYFTHIKDFAKLRDLPDLKVSKRRKKLYRFLALGYRNTPEQAKYLNQALDIMAAIIIPTSIIAYSLLAWLFGMNLRPGWHSSIFAPYFVLTAVYSGIALLIVIMWIYRKVYSLEKYITIEHFYYLGFVLIVLDLFYGYFTFSEYITEWYNSQKTPTLLLQKFFNFSEYGGLFIFSNFIAAFLPLIIIGIPWFRSVKSITITSALVIVALWIKRYLIIVPTLETPYIPIQDGRPDWVHYSATWVEWSLTIAGIATFILFFIFSSKLVPIIPVSAMEEKTEKIKIFYHRKNKV